MTFLIVEDDIIALELLIDILKKIVINNFIYFKASTLNEAQHKIKEHKPDIVFLDIELPDGLGIDLLDNIDEKYSFETIFTTSHDMYAIEALRKNAVDYILKPVTRQQIEFAINRVKERLSYYDKIKNAEQLISKVDDIKKKIELDSKIMLPTLDGLQIFYTKDIIKVEAEHNYTIFHLVNNKKIMSSKTLSNFEDKLITQKFFRIHRSFMINLSYLNCVKHDEERGFYVILSDGSELEIARRRRKEFMQLFA
jgi:two-component system LytT family response regulator